jgi:hypothetical protein
MNDARGENALLVGRLLALSALVLLAAGGAASAGWLPYAPGTARALGRTFMLIGALDLALAGFFMVRYRR